jgi:translation initiation factor 2 gamma subunit (eIF-2gamma)
MTNGHVEHGRELMQKALAGLVVRTQRKFNE